MAANKCVVVLAPNGRRQSVKVTPNTTILQILEEVCCKQGFKPEEYDIRHHNHVMDTSAIMRFSGLPNNAQLEMATAIKAREESNVMLGLQLESGDRLMGSFLPTVTLWDVIQNLCPEEADPESNPVIIYMRREVSGMRHLSETTLRNLGLTGGRAMLRFVHSTPEQLHYQANVSAPLQQRPSPIEANKTTDSPPEHPRRSPLLDRLFEAKPEPETTAMEIDESVLAVIVSAVPTPAVPTPAVTVPAVTAPVVTPPSVTSQLINNVGTRNPRNSTESRASEERSNRTNRVEVATEESTYEPEIILLGERNAIVFSLAMAQSVPYEDLPEDFYELTIEDARALYRDIKRARANMDDAPLVTSATRQLEQSTRVLTQLSNYKRTVLRIQFPDQTVLQGTFLPLETVGLVKEFVQKYLEDPQMKFHLFTTPPKVILSPDSRLVEVGCVPSAVVHFGLDKDQVADTYLRPDLLTRLSSPSAAALAASQSRGLVLNSRPFSAPVASGSSQQPSTSSYSHPPSTSRQAPPRQDFGPSNKVPKWFKPMK